MGQRLNIEIKSNGIIKANSYYHWSGYTKRALDLTAEILAAVKYKKSLTESQAIKALEVTGAGITIGELKYCSKPFQKNFNPDRFSVSRNDGRIGVSTKEKEIKRFWEEGRVTIDVSSKTVDFNVYHQHEEEDYERDWPGRRVLAPKVRSLTNATFGEIQGIRFAVTVAQCISQGLLFVKDENKYVSSIY